MRIRKSDYYLSCTRPPGFHSPVLQRERVSGPKSRAPLIERTAGNDQSRFASGALFSPDKMEYRFYRLYTGTQHRKLATSIFVVRLHTFLYLYIELIRSRMKV